MPSTALPSAASFSGSVTEGAFKTAHDLMIAYLVWLMGAAGDKLDISSHGQIKFPATQNASSNANTLDDYEEGTFTPTFTPGGGGTGLTYNYQEGNYIKIGRHVTVWGIIGASNIGAAAGAVYLSGLPFTTAAATYNNGGGATQEPNIHTSGQPSSLTVQASQTRAYLAFQAGAVITIAAFGAGLELRSGDHFRFSFTYLASA